MNEKEFREKIESRLSKYFNLYKEEKGYLYKSDGTKSLKRIDLIIQHKVEKDFVLGVEFKSLKLKKGYELANICLQMRQYSFIEWDYKNNHQNWGRIPIIACPNISLRYLKYTAGYQHPEEHDHNNVNSFLAQAFNIGEFRPKPVHQGRFLRICFANKVLWREADYDVDFPDELNYSRIRKQTERLIRDDVHAFNYGKIQENINKYVEQMKIGA